MRTLPLLLTACCLVALLRGAPQAFPASGQRTFTNSIGMEFVRIPAGSFNCPPYFSDEPIDVRTFIISKPFYLGKYQVTQAQWKAVMGSNPSKFKGPNNPVEQVSWHDVQEFIKRLNAREGTNRYRLPTDAEWELAARGGTRDIHLFFIPDLEFWSTWDRRDNEDPEVQWPASPHRLAAYAWFKRNSNGTTHPVGRKKPNQYGLYDIYGNVWEWVQDWWGGDVTDREIIDYRGPGSGNSREIRGCDWDSQAKECSSIAVYPADPSERNDGIGFRLALSTK